MPFLRLLKLSTFDSLNLLTILILEKLESMVVNNCKEISCINVLGRWSQQNKKLLLLAFEMN